MRLARVAQQDLYLKKEKKMAPKETSGRRWGEMAPFVRT